MPLCNDCNKHIYETQLAAYSAAINVSRRRGGSYRVYRCPSNPKHWHITHKRRGGRNRV